MVNRRTSARMRRALTTLQTYFDQRGNLIATRRSTAKATMILAEMISEDQRERTKRVVCLPGTHRVENVSNIVIQFTRDQSVLNQGFSFCTPMLMQLIQGCKNYEETRFETFFFQIPSITFAENSSGIYNGQGNQILCVGIPSQT